MGFLSGKDGTRWGIHFVQGLASYSVMIHGKILSPAYYSSFTPITLDMWVRENIDLGFIDRITQSSLQGQ